VGVRIVAIDWSGRRAGERRAIWAGHAQDGRLIALEGGRTRAEVVADLIALVATTERLVVGLDFSFSAPSWFLAQLGLASAYELWDAADLYGEQWLHECADPFWGRPGRRRPNLVGHLRRTEVGIGAKSVFQIGGAGAVGTGSWRGMPFLRQLRNAGFSIWPFDPPGWPRVIEIYPRLLTGPVVKSSKEARIAFLADRRWCFDGDLAAVAASSDDAFDAAISALVMAEHAVALAELEMVIDPVARLEGQVWKPRV